MTVRILTLAGIALLVSTAPAGARSSIDTGGGSGSSGELAAYLQCVPYARQVTGIRIFGDAHTWWKQAKGRYKRGNAPKRGAVMAFRPHGNSRLGHVAAVSKVVDSRTVLLRHANWSKPGVIEDNVQAVDVSPGNDWSQVRVWHGPSGSLGTTHWPIHGFIYSGKSDGGESRDRNRAVTDKFLNDPVGAIIAASMR